MNPTAVLATAVGAYLWGSIPWGWGVARLMGRVDPRTYGSGSIGATNVARALGFRAGALVLALDFLKGLLPALLALHLGGPWLGALAGLGAIAGHLWPVTLGFRGGKGVATGMGALAVLSPLAFGAGLAVGVAVIARTRYVSAGSLSGTLTALAVTALASALGLQGWPPLLYTGLGALAVVWAHRENLRRLRAGTERKLGERVEAIPPARPPRQSGKGL